MAKTDLTKKLLSRFDRLKSHTIDTKARFEEYKIERAEKEKEIPTISASNAFTEVVSRSKEIKFVLFILSINSINSFMFRII